MDQVCARPASQKKRFLGLTSPLSSADLNIRKRWWAQVRKHNMLAKKLSPKKVY